MDESDPRDLAVERFYAVVAQATWVRATNDYPLVGKRKHLRTLFIEKDPRSLVELAEAVRMRPLRNDNSWTTTGFPMLVLHGPDGYLTNFAPLGDDLIECNEMLPDRGELEVRGALRAWIDLRMPEASDS